MKMHYLFFTFTETEKLLHKVHLNGKSDKKRMTETVLSLVLS